MGDYRPSHYQEFPQNIFPKEKITTEKPKKKKEKIPQLKTINIKTIIYIAITIIILMGVAMVYEAYIIIKLFNILLTNANSKAN